MRNKFLWVCLLVLCGPQADASRPSIPESTAVRILVGEAADQGLKGMVCVAEVLRRRGSIHGFYGAYAPHVHHEARITWQMASRAWALSAHTHYTRGADHFENTAKFGTPWWAKNCVKTYQYKDHVFYKEILS